MTKLAADFSSGFNRKSTAEEVTEGVDLSGKTALVTGVASGLGQEAMRVMALRGARVIGMDRNQDATDAACSAVGADVISIACDLSDPNSIVEASKTVNKKVKSIDIVIANAGVMTPPYTTVDHYSEPLELQFAVNFLGHFILINRIMKRLEAADSARIALVASEGYTTAPKKIGIQFDDLDFSEKYVPLTAYGHSKLAVMLFNIALAKRLEGTNITSNSVHPGVIRTNLAHDTDSFVVKMISALAGPWTRSIAQGAATHCYVAANPQIDGVSGMHFADSNPKDPKEHERVKDMELAEQLWAKAEELAKGFLV